VASANPPTQQEIAAAIEQGLAHHRAGRLDHAREFYRTVLKRYPGQAAAHHLLGLVELQRGNPAVAVQCFEQAIAANSGVAEYHHDCGIACAALSRFEAALDCYHRALAIKPDFANALFNQGNALHKLGRLAAAESAYRAALRIQPRFAQACNNLGIILQQRDDQRGAIVAFEQALANQPGFADARNNLGNALHALERPDEALEAYAQAIQANPKFIAAHLNTGNLHKQQGRLQAAMEAYQHVLTLHANHAEALYNLGNTLIETGQIEAGHRSYRQALQARPGFPAAYRSLAMSGAHLDDTDLDAMQSQLAATDCADDDAMQLSFALGAVLDRQGNYDQAFHHFQQANRLRRAQFDYDPNQEQERVSELIAAFGDILPQAASDSELPVFIVGMPRSGTTLVEQILASHPMVFGAGELDFMQRTERAITATCEPGTSPAQKIASLTEAELKDISDRYLDTLPMQSANAARISDKMPRNFLSIGLINRLFSRAHIIHCQRDPMDTCLSIYFQFFSARMPYAYDLQEVADYYLQYHRIMQHWQRVSALKILPLQYEDLVTNQEQVSRRLVRFLGLPWDDNCLHFHRHARAVSTASLQQVRQKIYTTSVQRWRHYEPHLGPLHERLAPLYETGD